MKTIGFVFILYITQNIQADCRPFEEAEESAFLNRNGIARSWGLLRSARRRPVCSRFATQTQVSRGLVLLPATPAKQ